MSFSEEKMLILKMLQEGKITSEEAARLLEALDGGAKQGAGAGAAGGGAKQNSQQSPHSDFYEEMDKMKERLKDWKNEFKKTYNEKEFDKIIEDISTKAEKIGKNVAVTTVGIVDRVIDYVGSFVDTNSFNIFGSYAAADRSFEASAAEGMNLDIEAVNGSIVLKRHQENKIIIKTRVRSPQNNADSILIYSQEEGTVSMKINKIGNISVMHEIYIPAVSFDKIRLETKNGKIYVEDSISGNFEAINKNASIELMGVNAKKVQLSTKNAKVQVSYIMAESLDINTSNSVIDIKHIKSSSIRSVTTNGRILVENVQCFEGSPHISMDLITSNGDIKAHVNDMDEKGYRVKAKTSNGSINILVPEMVYHNSNLNQNSPGSNFVEAESRNFEGALEKVIINAQTNNGYIEILK